jgi:hypothetical protein
VLLIATSMAFSRVLADERIPDAVTGGLLDLAGGRV